MDQQYGFVGDETITIISNQQVADIWKGYTLMNANLSVKIWNKQWSKVTKYNSLNYFTCVQYWGTFIWYFMLLVTLQRGSCIRAKLQHFERYLF